MPVDEEEVEVCDPQPAYAMYVAEAELERLNMARQPDNVLEQKLTEDAIRLASADEITLDGADRITTAARRSTQPPITPRCTHR